MSEQNGHKRVIHVDLSESGFDGQWVDIRNPWFMSQKQFNANRDRGKEDPQAFLREMLAACALRDVDDQALTDPATADFETVPLGVVNVLTTKILELFEQTVPKALRTEQSLT